MNNERFVLYMCEQMYGCHYNSKNTFYKLLKKYFFKQGKKPSTSTLQWQCQDQGCTELQIVAGVDHTEINVSYISFLGFILAREPVFGAD